MNRNSEARDETWYSVHRAAGLCGLCSETAIPGLSTCQRHRSKYHPDRYVRLRSSGRCGHCHSRSAAPGKASCPGCLTKKRKHERDRRLRAVAAGLCSICKRRRSVSGARRCPSCKERRRARVRATCLQGAPRTRGDCSQAQRPCPYETCRYHLYLDVRRGALQPAFPGRDLADIPETCALDVADRGGAPRSAIGKMLNLSTERIRQVEQEAFSKMIGCLGEWSPLE